MYPIYIINNEYVSDKCNSFVICKMINDKNLVFKACISDIRVDIEHFININLKI